MYIGPLMYIVAGLNLKPLFPGNYFDKYAHDSYLIVPACSSTAAAELANIETWAQCNNLKLNLSKSVEMVVFASEQARSKCPVIDPIPGITQVDQVKILGVFISSNLSMGTHVSTICKLLHAVFTQ